MARRPRVPQTIPNSGPARVAELRRRIRELRQTAESLRKQGLAADAAYYEREQRAALRRLYGIQGGGARARNAIVRNAQRAAANPGLGHQGRMAAARARRGQPFAAPNPPNPAMNVHNAQVVPPLGTPAPASTSGPRSFSSWFPVVASYVSRPSWQPPAVGALPAPGTAGPTQPLAPTQPGQVPPPPGTGTGTGTVPPATNPPATNPPSKKPSKAQKRLQASVDAIRVGIDRLSGFVEGHAPTPGGLAPLIWTLVVLLVAVVPVNANGATRLKLLWYTLTGNAWLPGVQYGRVSQAAAATGEVLPTDNGAINQAPPRGVGGAGGIGGLGAAGLGIFGTGAPVRVPTSLPLGGGALDLRPLRFPGRATQHGGHGSRVAQVAQTGLNVHSGGVRITPPPPTQGANPVPYAPTSPQAPLIFPPGRPRLPGRGGR